MRFIIDEMFPPAAAGELRRLGHDAVAVAGAELAGASDEFLYETAVAQGRIVVTENVRDFIGLQAERLQAGQPAIAVACVLKRHLPRGSAALAPALALRLDTWAKANPDPVAGPHWPRATRLA
ncbi:DUF5615 family PIN-like protein [Candidatus Poriferisodalis sp.]|uniref:DUF5615 family PIN-like protein n=1 Tax=Candidatus Poriferisodalis sp. TaxID=3101277 RepID=UPI003B02E5E0